MSGISGTNEYPHVTQVIDILRKKGLEFYFKVHTPEWLKAESVKNLGIGKLLHTVIEKYIETPTKGFEIDTEYPTEIDNSIKSLFLFKQENPQFKLKKSEIEVVSQKWGYQGRLDCIASVGKE